MIELRSLVERSAKAEATLSLPYELRSKSRLRVKLDSGEDASLMLPRGTVLRGGDRLLAADGRIVGVIARPERVLHIESASPQALARCAYHLGNRHVPVEIDQSHLRIAEDHVLESMLVGLGAKLGRIEAPFEPESGAYHGDGHAHEHERPGRIHEYGEHRHE
jgi:urease accessory protein